MPATHEPAAGAPDDVVTRDRKVRAVRNVGYLAAAEVVGKVGSLVIVVLAGRMLGSEAFGVFSFALALGLLVAMVPAWGSDSVVTRDGARSAEHLPGYLAQALALRAVGMVILGVGALGWLMVGSPKGVDLVAGVAIVAAALIDTVSDAYRAALGALEQQQRPAIVLMIQRVVTALALTVLLFSGAGLVPFALVFLAGSVLGAALMALAVRREGVRPQWSAVQPRSVLTLLRASGYVGLNGVVAMALFRIDAVLLGVLDSATSVGLYAAAYRLVETVLFVAWSVGRALLPMFSNTEAGAAATVARSGVMAMVAIFVPYAVVLGLRGEDLVVLLFGAEYAPHAAAILAWVSITPALFAIGYLLGILLIARDRTRQVALTSGAALVVNICLNVLLIPIWGAVGAAAATTLSYAVCALTTVALTQRFGGTWEARSLIPVAVGAVVVAAILALPLPVLLVAALAAVGYSIAWWVLSVRFAPRERELLLDVLGRGRAAG